MVVRLPQDPSEALYTGTLASPRTPSAKPVAPLGPIFLAALRPEVRALLEGAADLEGALARFVEASQAPWPELRVEATTFLPYVAARLETVGPPGDVLASVHGSDLFVACACVSG